VLKTLLKTTILVVLVIFYYQNGNMSIIREKMNLKLGMRLKELREEQGLTQKQLSNKLNINSVTYLHYEKEQREPPLSLLADIAQFYNVSVDYLLGLEN